MTISELISFFNFKELIRFYQLNKACKAILTPGGPKCLRFDVLFQKRMGECKLTWPTWREDIAAVLAETNSFGKVIQVAQSFVHEVPNTLYGNTYTRARMGELLGYGGGNDSMHTNNPSYFARRSIEKSTFGKPLLHLRSVCWLNPYAIVENIPKSWQKINIAINHVYLHGFDMQSSFVRIWHCPMADIKDKTKAPLTVLHNQEWPLPSANSQPRNVLVSEPVITINLPDEQVFKQSYLLKLEVFAESGNWKSGWMFEGITITNAAMA